MRNIVAAPRNRITQGTIFCGVKSRYDDDCDCYGICITARCDTARDFKAQSLTFLSVVALKDWLWFEAKQKAIDDQIKSASGVLKRHLIKKYGSAAAYDAFGVDAGFSVSDMSDKEISAQKKLYDEAVGFGCCRSRYDWLSAPSSIKKKVSGDFLKLATRKNQEYYFLEMIEPSYGGVVQNSETGYVVALRDIRIVSREVGLKIADGLDFDEYQRLSISDSTVGQLRGGTDFVSFPVGEIVSPYIEQLMQDFSNLFGRIGVADVSDSLIDSVNQYIGV